MKDKKDVEEKKREVERERVKRLAELKERKRKRELWRDQKFLKVDANNNNVLIFNYYLTFV